MAERKSEKSVKRDLLPEFSEAKSHLLKAQKEFLLAVRSVLDKAIERAEDVAKKQKKKTIKITAGTCLAHSDILTIHFNNHLT